MQRKSFNAVTSHGESQEMAAQYSVSIKPITASIRQQAGVETDDRRLVGRNEVESSFFFSLPFNDADLRGEAGASNQIGIHINAVVCLFLAVDYNVVYCRVNSTSKWRRTEARFLRNLQL